MATTKQKKAAKENIKKAGQRWQEMTPRQHALAQPEGRMRAKPGTKGGGDYFCIVVRPKEEFITFRYHDVGEKVTCNVWPGKGAVGLGILNHGSSVKRMPIWKVKRWSPIPKRRENCSKHSDQNPGM